MKTLIFKSLTVLFAVASAIVSVKASGLFAAEQPHVKYQVGGVTQCTTINVNACTTTVRPGQVACRVTVQNGDGTIINNYQAYNHTCASLQFNTSGASVGSKVLDPGEIAVQ